METSETGPETGLPLRNRTVWVACTIIVVLVASLLGGIVAYVAPRTYESRCVIELLPASPEVAKLSEGETLADQVRTAAVVMVSQGTCMRASEELDLSSRWGIDRESTIRVLQKVVSAEVIPGTTLIEIRSRMTDADDSRDVAIEIAKAYRDRLKEIEASEIDIQLQSLDHVDGDLDFQLEQLGKRFDVDAPDGVIREEMADMEGMKKQIAEERERLRLRRAVPVKRVVIHEEPTLARSPVAPNVPIIFASWSLGGLAVGLG